jgi:pyruvate dehydrogenase E2 component (dihydrolipoyllysine-residue acetyltransferase)
MANVFLLPDIGEGLTEAEIVEWLVDEGSQVSADQPMVTVETDKTQVELPAPVSGILIHRGAPEGAILEVGSVLAVIGEHGESWSPDRASTPQPQPPSFRDPDAGGEPASGYGGLPKALPLVRKRAKEEGVDLADVRGTGQEGRITRSDLEAHLANRRPAVERPPLVGTLVESAEDLSGAPVRPQGRSVRLSPTRRAIADRMSRSWREIPHVTTFDAFDATRLLEARRTLSERLDHRVPLEALMIREIVPAIIAHPEFNATLAGDVLELHDHIDVGVAIDGDDGLLVGVVRDVMQRSVADLAADIDRLVLSAVDRTLTREDVTGATFTLSNIGAVGGGYGTPIIPLGTTAILSIGRATDEAVARAGRVVVAPMAPLSLSYDHRVIDGALGRAFLAMVRDNLATSAPIE